MEQLLEDDEDRCRTGVPFRRKVGEPPSRRDGKTDLFHPPPERFQEKVRGVVGEKPVNVGRDDPMPGNHTRQGTVDGRLDDLQVQQVHVLLCEKGVRRDGLPRRIEGAPPGQAPVRVFHRPAVHAGFQFVGVGEMVDPVDPEGGPVGRRGAGEKRRTRPVRQHPAEEIGLEGQDRPSLQRGFAFGQDILEHPGPQERGGQFGAGHDGVPDESQRHVHGGVLQRADSREADSGRGDDFAGGAGQLAVHHQPVPRKELIRGGRSTGKALDIRGRESRVRFQAAYRLGGELGIRMRDAAGGRIDGVVALPDPVFPQDDASGPGRFPADHPENLLHGPVVDRRVRKKCRQVGDVNVHLRVSPQSLASAWNALINPAYRS